MKNKAAANGNAVNMLTLRRPVLVRGCGAAVPARVLVNADLPAHLNTDDTWIYERTGIRSRHIAADGETTSHLATLAARKACAAAAMDANDIDLLIIATTTPDYTFPATAALVQKELGIIDCAAFDVQAVCAGFVYALTIAANLLQGDGFKRALVIGAETFSRIVDWNDRSTCVLFGDGAGAVVIEAVASDSPAPSSSTAAAPAPPSSTSRGVIAARLHTDGRYWDRLYVDGGPSTTGQVGHVRMLGREVFRHAVSHGSAVIHEVLAAAGVTIDDIDWFVPHQANRRILDATAAALGMDPDKMIVTVDRYANTSAASIPLSLDLAVKDGKIKPGDLILLQAMGGGFSWGAIVLRW